MKLKEISFTPIAAVSVTAEEIALLCECSEKHNDAACKAASSQGGFLYGMKNYEDAEPGSLHRLTFRELDTLAKIAEMWRFRFDEEKAKKVMGIGFEMRRILIELNNSVPSPLVCNDQT